SLSLCHYMTGLNRVLPLIINFNIQAAHFAGSLKAFFFKNQNISYGLTTSYTSLKSTSRASP
ncbi:hypothetical protein, partial [Kingella kingae]|uniref:hypothetical protein n=1 Tax=Kingella kingae TaxID=504 RepID=UPI001E3DAD20